MPIVAATAVLFVNPTAGHHTNPAIDDKYTRLAAYLLTRAASNPETTGAHMADGDVSEFCPDVSNRDSRQCSCGANGTDQDYLIGTVGDVNYVANWLLVHYLAHCRSMVPAWVFGVLNDLQHELAIGDADLPPATPELLLSPNRTTTATTKPPVPPAAKLAQPDPDRE